MNTTDSAVRITHIPTGVSVSMQDERSQHKNKAKAMKLLLARLYDLDKAAEKAEAQDLRNAAAVADRSERIRSYFQSDRLTEHRVGLTIHGSLQNFMNGDVGTINEVIYALRQNEQSKLLTAAVNENK